MKKCLYFICPTDCLETIIEKAFQQESYFYSSLGNSVTFGNNELRQTRKLIRARNIGEISFVLSYENRIVMDALGSQDFSDIRGLNSFYRKVLVQKENLEASWQASNPKLLIISSFLNAKIKELKHGLSDLIISQLSISGKVYHKRQNIFEDIYSDLICQEDFILN